MGIAGVCVCRGASQPLRCLSLGSRGCHIVNVGIVIYCFLYCHRTDYMYVVCCCLFCHRTNCRLLLFVLFLLIVISCIHCHLSSICSVHIYWCSLWFYSHFLECEWWAQSWALSWFRPGMLKTEIVVCYCLYCCSTDNMFVDSNCLLLLPFIFYLFCSYLIMLIMIL